jgi:Flp pilus assembly pilin Flp
MNKDKPGVSAVEYALLLALIAVAVVLALGAMGISVREAHTAILEALAGETPCEVYYQSDFDDGTADWYEVKSGIWGRRGSWQVQGGQLIGPRLGCALFKPSGGGDYQVTLDSVRVQHHSNAWNGYGVLFRAGTDAKGRLEGYMFEFERVNPQSEYMIYFSYWIQGYQVQITPPGSQQAPAGWDSPRELSITAEGNTFTASLNGKPIMTATDNKGLFSKGLVGVATNDGSSLTVGGLAVHSVGCKSRP